MVSYITKWADKWADITAGWSATAASVTFFGMNLPTLLLTACTIWWTIERARETRAKRRTEELRAQYYEDEMERSKPVRKGLIAWARGMMTRPAEMDSQSGHDNGAGR